MFFVIAFATRIVAVDLLVMYFGTLPTLQCQNLMVSSTQPVAHIAFIEFTQALKTADMLARTFFTLFLSLVEIPQAYVSPCGPHRLRSAGPSYCSKNSKRQALSQISRLAPLVLVVAPAPALVPAAPLLER